MGRELCCTQLSGRPCRCTSSSKRLQNALACSSCIGAAVTAAAAGTAAPTARAAGPCILPNVPDSLAWCGREKDLDEVLQTIVFEAVIAKIKTYKLAWCGREKDLDEVLQTTAVFSNVSKGVLAKRECDWRWVLCRAARGELRRAVLSS